MTQTEVQALGDVNARDEYGDTHLHRAVCYDAYMCLELIQARADVDAVGRYNMTPLHKAADLGRRDAIRMLLDANANVNARNGNGDTPLHLVFDDADSTRMLIEAGAFLEATNNDGETPLQSAVHCMRYATIVQLLEAGANKDVCVGEGYFYENSREDVISYYTEFLYTRDDQS